MYFSKKYNLNRKDDKNMRIIKTMMLSLRMKLHWCFIRYYRKRFDVLYDAGESLTSERIQTLNQRISKHTTAVMCCEKQYRTMQKNNQGIPKQEQRLPIFRCMSGSGADASPVQ